MCVAVLTPLVSLIKNRDIYSLVSAASISFILISVVRSLGYSEVNLFSNVLPHYLIPIMPFFIVSLLKLKETLKSTPTKLLFNLALAYLIIYPGLVPTPFNQIIRHDFERQKEEFYAIDYAKNFLPKSDKRIFTEGLNIYGRVSWLTEKHNKIDFAVLDYSYFSGYFDRHWSPRIKSILTSRRIDVVEEVPAVGEKLLSDLDNKEYFAIISGPYTYVQNDIEYILDHFETTGFEEYCTIRIPHADIMTRIILFDHDHCVTMRDDVLNYYLDKHDYFCEKSQKLAYRIKSTMKMNAMDFEKTCDSGAENEKLYQEPPAFLKNEILALIIILVVVSLMTFIQGRKNNK